MVLDFGQPPGGILQVSYVVEDIDRAALNFAASFKLGPWFIRGPFQPAQAIYRGQKTDISISLAMTFSGHVMVELVQQHDDKPSVYREMIDRQGYGFHHWGVATQNFDADVADYRARGTEVAFFDITPIGTRIAYVDTARELGGMIELIELTPEQEKRYTAMYVAALGWDGQDLLRRS